MSFASGSLGFTHHWGKSRRGYWVARQQTAKDRFSRALHRIRRWCHVNTHEPLITQQHALAQKLDGHYGYYGRTSNYQAPHNFWRETQKAERKWLSCRSHMGYVNWTKMDEWLKRFPFPRPRIVHSYVAWRTHVLRSRMREFRTSESVGASGGNLPGDPTTPGFDMGQQKGISAP